jgi:hypothetical protein
MRLSSRAIRAYWLVTATIAAVSAIASGTDG